MNLERPHNDEELQIWRLYAPLETRAGILFVEWRWEPRRYRLGGAEGVVLKTAGVERLIQVLARNEPWAPGPIAWNPPVLLIGDQAYQLGKRGHLILARVLNQMLREIEPLP